MGEGVDPRKAESLRASGCCSRSASWYDEGRIDARLPRDDVEDDARACGADHRIETENVVHAKITADEDMAKMVYRVDAKPGEPIKLTKAVVVPHLARGAGRANWSTAAVAPSTGSPSEGIEQQFADQRGWLDAYWARSDVVVAGQPAVQQAVRWNLFQLAQAAGRAERTGSRPKGVSGSGYGGHYFWDTEIYVMPFLTYTSPDWPATRCASATRCCRAACRRAQELHQNGALFPWRTINGEEASAYYAAGTAQYHIDADISYAVSKYVDATGDEDFLLRDGIDILVQTARMWADLGFWAIQRRRARSTSTGSPGPTSTRPSSTTTCSPT